MARPHKQTVDYFPHDTDASGGRTLTILQSKYGNDGYAFWFKLLELLGRTAGHYFDYNDQADLEFLCAKTHQKDTETILDILETLTTLGAIDKQLQKAKIIWCQKFVDGVSDAYERTIDGLPRKPAFLVNVDGSGVSVAKLDDSANNNPENTTLIQQTKLNYTKGDDTETITEIHIDEIARELWLKALEDIKGRVSAGNFKTWFEKTCGISCQDNNFTIGAPSNNVIEYLSKNQLTLVATAIMNVTGEDKGISFVLYKENVPGGGRNNEEDS